MSNVTLWHLFYTSCKDKCFIFALPRHGDVCSYKRFNCLVADCKWVGRAGEIQDHGLTRHKELCASVDRIKIKKGQQQVRFGDDATHPYWLIYNYTNEGVNLVVQSLESSSSNLLVKVKLQSDNGQSAIVFTQLALRTVDNPMNCLSTNCLEIPNKLIAKYSNRSELNLLVEIEEIDSNKATEWLTPCRVFTAAFVVNCFLFVWKHWGIKQKCS